MASRNEELKRELAAAGIGADVVETAFQVDAILQRWRRRFVKRELGQRAIAELGLPVDLLQLDALSVIWSPSNEMRDADQESEIMVGTVAQRLAIDPSRASRTVGSLIQLGLVRRAPSQQDARRAILELTGDGEALVAAVRHYKFLMLGAYFNGWTDEERAAFLPLLDRFSDWSTNTRDPDGKVALEIEALRKEVATHFPAAAEHKG